MFRFWYFDPGYVSNGTRTYDAESLQESLAGMSLRGHGEYLIYEG